jgi:sigma-B regulation protein RsbU (phosphoserine phosphatase)
MQEIREMARQLRAIGDLQRRLLPREVPQPTGWRLAAHYVVGRWPGGDYYDFITLPDGRLLLLVADASDEGAASAALVAMTRVVLHSCPLSSGVEQLPFCPLRDPVIQPPHILLGHLNRVLGDNSLEEQFMTAFCGVLDPIDGFLHYTNAGHPSPRWWRATERAIEPLREASGLPLGMERNVSYHHKRIEIGRGDILVLYSDGLTAALNGEGQWFGCDRLDDAIHQNAREGAAAVKGAVMASLEEFLDGEDPADDVTLLVIERMR